MADFLIKRFIHSVIIIIGISMAVFFISRLTGDPVSLMVDFSATQEERAILRQQLGLDKPLPVQYWLFVKGAVKGDFGNSIRYSEPAMGLVVQRLPVTLKLIFFTMFFSLAIAIPIGVISALKRNSFIDLASMAFTFLGQAVPSFWLGIMLIMVVGVKFRLLPISGYGGGDLTHMIMPALTLGAFAVASFARITRSSMLAVLDMDYVQTARAKGNHEVVVIVKHALRNAMIPIVTILGLHIALAIGGAVITEQIFAYPGVGWLSIQSIYNRDFPVVQAIVMIVSVGVVLINFIVDILYTFIDPRIRYEKGK